MTMLDSAPAFFEACDSGKGWDGCKPWCDATISCQADALACMITPSGYTEWMKGLLGPIPDGRYELQAFAVDEARGSVVAVVVFHGTNTVAGPVPPHRQVGCNRLRPCVEMKDGAVRHLTKVWNDMHALRALGWA